MLRERTCIRQKAPDWLGRQVPLPQVVWLLVVAGCLCVTKNFTRANCLDRACDASESHGHASCGPNNCCSRGTLFQWSYGTNFTGGPPSMDEPLATDRPDFTESSTTVGRGVVQLEFGYTYLYDNDDVGSSVREHSVGEPLLRVGVCAEWLELRVAWAYLSQRARSFGAPDEFLTGGSDLYVGAKIGLTPQEEFLPEMAIIPGAWVPCGGDGLSDEEVLPSLNWCYTWEVSDAFSVAGNTQGNRAQDDSGEFFFLMSQSVALSYKLTEKIGSYVEWFAFFPNGAETARTQHFLDGGFTYLVNNNLQWDVRVGTGLNQAANDFFTGTGFVVRF